MKHIEDQHQKMLFDWASHARLPTGQRIRDLMFAVPNGGKRNAKEAARLKSQGVKAGVSDVFLAYPADGKHGLFIELKKPKATKSDITENQAKWLNTTEQAGYSSVAAFGFDAARSAVTHYLSGHLTEVIEQVERLGFNINVIRGKSSGDNTR